ncbi:hypothetical protein [Paraherbaspirillum soli]|uniref:Uncharacterized protein n=1 Tax=Paraherbaspirillum soli TaxID=631222 RepID=A0ABW0M7K6_9BURK
MSLNKMYKFFKTLVLGILFLNNAFAVNFPSNQEQSKNCPISFEYPDSLEVYVAPSESFNSENIFCRLVFLYKNKIKSNLPEKTSGDGVLEISDVVIDVLKEPPENRFKEYSFEKKHDGRVIYIGQINANKEKSTHINEFVSPVQIVKMKSGANLYIGEAIVFETDGRGKIKKSKRTDLLIGNEEKSVGLIFWESTRDQNSLGKSKIWVAIFKSIKMH